MSDAARTNKDMATECVYTAGSPARPVTVQPAVRISLTIKPHRKQMEEKKNKPTRSKCEESTVAFVLVRLGRTWLRLRALA